MASANFQELDVADTDLGELVLRRRRTVAAGDEWVYEVKLAGRFLMSSLNTQSERELADRALAKLAGDGLRVLVGGLGLGFTAAAALRDPRVAQVDVVERLPQVIDWHRRGLVPLGASLCADARCRFVLADCLQLLQRPGELYDAILIDIDDSPIHLLDASHESFYAVAGLQAARRRLRTGGVFALWTSLPAEPEVTARMGAAFADAAVETVVFDNPLLEEPEANALYFGRA